MKDGLLIYIIGAEVAAGGKPWLDSGPSKCKEMIEKKGKLIDAYRLPEGVFARTNVVSDIVVFKKR
jgi:sugar lactone lactonase YvrE